MQTGPHLLLIQSWFRIASIRRASSSARRVSQRTGSAPAISSSQRGHPAVLRPKTGPPHVCLVVIFIHPYCFGVSILSHRYRKESVALPYLFVYQSSSTCGLAVYLFIFRSASKRLRPCDLMFFIWAFTRILVARWGENKYAGSYYAWIRPPGPRALRSCYLYRIVLGAGTAGVAYKKRECMSCQDWRLKIRIERWPDPHAASYFILAISHNPIHSLCNYGPEGKPDAHTRLTLLAAR